MISSVVATGTGIRATLGERSLELSWSWLRDHATDEESYLASANQRMVPPAVVASAVAGDAVVVDDGASLRVSWPDGTTTAFACSFLERLGDASVATDVGSDARPWTGLDMRRRVEPLGADDISTDTGLSIALDHFWRDGIVIVDDVPTDHASTRSVLERFGYVRSTIFGDLWEFSSDGGFDDTASTPLAITPHTDGTYSHDAPGLLGLHCHVYDATGGENVFVDAHTLAERLTPSSRTTLRSVDIAGQYVGDGAHLMARRPALRYERGRLVQVSYNHHDRAPMLLPEPEMSELYAALHEFDALADQADLQFELALRPGEMVLFDNWRVLHGRRAFRGERLIAGGYVNREDVESTTRLLGR